MVTFVPRPSGIISVGGEEEARNTAWHPLFVCACINFPSKVQEWNLICSFWWIKSLYVTEKRQPRPIILPFMRQNVLAAKWNMRLPAVSFTLVQEKRWQMHVSVRWNLESPLWCHIILTSNVVISFTGYNSGIYSCFLVFFHLIHNYCERAWIQD